MIHSLSARGSRVFASRDRSLGGCSGQALNAFSDARLANQCSSVEGFVAGAQFLIRHAFCHGGERLGERFIESERLADEGEFLLRGHQNLCLPQEAQRPARSGAGLSGLGLRADVLGIAFGDGDVLIVLTALCGVEPNGFFIAGYL